MTQSPLSPCRRGGAQPPLSPCRRSWRGDSNPLPPLDVPGGGNSASMVRLQTPLEGGGLSPIVPLQTGGTQPPLSPCRLPYGGNSAPIVPLQTPQREVKSASIVPFRRGDSAPIVPLQTGELNPHCPHADAPGGRGARPSLSPCRRVRGDSVPIVPQQTLLEGGGLGPHCPPADG